MILTTLMIISLFCVISGVGYNSLRRSFLNEDLKAIQDSQNERLERIQGTCSGLREDVRKLNQRMGQVENDLRCLTPMVGEDFGREDP